MPLLSINPQSDASSIEDWELHAGDLRQVEARKAAKKAERARQELPREDRVRLIAGEMARVSSSPAHERLPVGDTFVGVRPVAGTGWVSSACAEGRTVESAACSLSTCAAWPAWSLATSPGLLSLPPQAKADAAAAKASGNQAQQKACGQLIGQLRQEMRALGISDAELEAIAVPAAAGQAAEAAAEAADGAETEEEEGEAQQDKQGDPGSAAGAVPDAAV